jgi:hypothetical protein
MHDDSGTTAPQQRITGGASAELLRPEVDIEFVDRLPGGRVVMPVEQKNRFVWLVVHGHMSPQAREDMVSALQRIVGNRLWEQNWQPPQAS